MNLAALATITEIASVTPRNRSMSDRVTRAFFLDVNVIILFLRLPSGY